MQAFQQRVIEEKKDLDIKIEKLRGFLIGEHPVLPIGELQRLERQEKIMSLYSDVLAERITAFDRNKND